MLVVLFGLAGSGKNYIGEMLGNNYGFTYWDADAMLTPAMQSAIDQNQEFTQDMRDEFTTEVIAQIKKLHNENSNLIVSQALYKEKNRQEILTAFPKAKLIWIKTSPEKIAEHLQMRNSKVTKDYAQLISKHFEEPPATYGIIKNTTYNEIISQWDKLFQQ